ncbi:MAG: antibiotic biosynthesis monooxygenase [Verrucomicrobiales bacterium]|nr:antibiotic biosynthesis monooxygenase [Verrucomicrobiales bacterium]MCP5560007.1 antibiotic biosynthesis monooxygenase [Verrucomicrobiaceae bacterium]
MSLSIATTPAPPYFAVIFTSLRTDGDQGYARIAQRMLELAATQSGFLGVESARGDDGLGITVSYWGSLEDIQAWKQHEEHEAAQKVGRSVWYAAYQVRICEVMRSYAL